MAVADWYETLISKRPNKKVFSPDEAANIIRTNSGIHFDPSIATLFDNDNFKKAITEAALKLNL